MQNDKNYDRILKENDLYRKMIDNLSEEIFVTDGEGKVLFINPISTSFLGKSFKELVGRNVTELVAEGYMSKSSTLEAIKQRKTVDVIQKLWDNTTVLATAIPIFNDEKTKIKMVVTTSRKVEDVVSLLEKYEESKKELLKKEREIADLKEELFAEEKFISQDPVTREIKKKIQKVAKLDVTVMIEGETGVGKEVAAKSIHRFSNRKDKPFIKINCGLIAESLIESELFGYEKGAFTGANQEGKPGKIEKADGGTLFLDEIGELPLEMQVKLLDFLQDGSFTRIGGTKKRTINARIVTATNRNLKEMCQNGTFREDLYFRLDVFPIQVPPLRERREDIPVLVKYFLTTFNSKYQEAKTVNEEAMRALEEYSWPGNIRELEHIIERAHIMAEGSLIDKETLELFLSDEDVTKPKGIAFITPGTMSLKEAKAEVEKEMLTQAKRKCTSTYKMGELLGVDQSTIVKLLKKHNIQ